MSEKSSHRKVYSVFTVFSFAEEAEEARGEIEIKMF
jgi:hypothetical protein